MRLLRMDGWQGRLLAAALGMLATAGVGWFGFLKDQIRTNENHEQRIVTLERSIAEIPERTADRVVRELRKGR